MIPNPLSPNAAKVADFVRSIFKSPDGDALLPSVEVPSVKDVIDEIIEHVRKLDLTDYTSDILGKLKTEEFIEPASDYVRDFMRAIFSQPQSEEIAEIFGQAVMGPFIHLMERYADDPEANPEDFAAAFHGLSIMLTLPEFISKAMKGSVIGTVLGEFGDGFKSIYWNLGLGFLGWQTLAPFLSAGLQPRLERHFNAKFLPKRFDLSTQAYLYNTGKITAAELLRYGKELGWRPFDTQTVVELSYRTLSDNDIKDLYDAGVLNADGIKNELLKRGEHPRYVATFAKRILQAETEKQKSPTITQVRKAFKLGVYSEIQFRQMLKQLDFSDLAINLEVQLTRLEQETEALQLTQSQVKDAFIKDVITSAEVTRYLNESGMTLNDIAILLKTWNAAKRPKILKVNQSTIKDALRTGVLNVSQALAKLKEIGYESESAQLIIDTALANMKLARVRISVDKLVTALGTNVITENEFRAQLTARNYIDSDINVFVKLAKRQTASGLSVEDIRQAFIYGAIDEGQAVSYQVAEGQEQKDAQLRLETWRKQKLTFRQTPTIGALIVWYQQKLISSSQLQQRLQQAGFSAEEAQLTIKSADGAFPREASSGEIKEMYLNAAITKDRALTLLKASGLDQQSAGDLIKAWDHVLSASIPNASVNHLLAAFADEIINEQELTQKLKEKGYRPNTIDFYIKLANGQTFEVTKELSKSDITGLFKDEIISYENALERLIKQGYSAEDSELLLARGKPSIENSQVHSLFVGGYINPDEYVDILTSLDYDLNDINDYLTRMGF